MPGLVEVLRTEGIEGVRYAPWDTTERHRAYDPCVWRSRATDDQKQVGWEMWARMEKIIAAVLHEAHERQVGEAADASRRGRRASIGAALIGNSGSRTRALPASKLQSLVTVANASPSFALFLKNLPSRRVLATIPSVGLVS